MLLVQQVLLPFFKNADRMSRRQVNAVVVKEVVYAKNNHGISFW